MRGWEWRDLAFRAAVCQRRGEPLQQRAPRLVRVRVRARARIGVRVRVRVRVSVRVRVAAACSAPGPRRPA